MRRSKLLSGPFQLKRIDTKFWPGRRPRDPCLCRLGAWPLSPWCTPGSPGQSGCSEHALSSHSINIQFYWYPRLWNWYIPWSLYFLVRKFNFIFFLCLVFDGNTQNALASKKFIWEVSNMREYCCCFHLSRRSSSVSTVSESVVPALLSPSSRVKVKILLLSD